MNPLVAQKMLTIIERHIASERFNIKRLTQDLLNQNQCIVSKCYGKIGSLLPTEKESMYCLVALLRFSFLIEPVNEAVTSTKYATRWSDLLADNDPRKASYLESCKVFVKAVNMVIFELTNSSKKKQFKEIISELQHYSKIAFEFPIDYYEPAKGHKARNIQLINKTFYHNLLKLREFIFSKDSEIKSDIQEIYDKTLVKCYLTDRALTGNYKTNREKRWEAHPNSPQFATREDCFGVEYELILQLFLFKGFPKKILEAAEPILKKALPNRTGNLSFDVARCPITYEELDFKRFMNSAKNPEHGKSPYQVGHLNPLKAGESLDFRHNARNIAWVSEDGNRIQGSLSLKRTKEMIGAIAKRYSEFDSKE